MHGAELDAPVFVIHRILWLDTLNSPGNCVPQIFVIVLNRHIRARANLRHVIFANGCTLYVSGVWLEKFEIVKLFTSRNAVITLIFHC